MLLTILELWIACDKAAIHHHAMLEDYDVCVPMGKLESLVLPFRSQLERLARAEDYMKQRRKRLRFPASNIFQDSGISSCFSIRFFDQSTEHQAILATIVKCATRDRVAKQDELPQNRKDTETCLQMLKSELAHIAMSFLTGNIT
jgi:hypothetical protein